METRNSGPAGMRGFTVVWAGQVISLLGTAMSDFALTLWAYQITGKATPLALVGFFFLLPGIVLSPLIGVWVDRGNRKLMMMLSDLAAALVTLIILVLHLSDGLQIWHLYMSALVSGTFQAFQWPAYSATISLMLPKDQYARANGMLDMADASSGVLAPMLAGALLGSLGLTGLLGLDLVTAAFAIGSLLLVRIPQPPRAHEDTEERPSLLRDASYGFRYVLQRPSLLGLQTVFMAWNFFSTLAFAVFAPMILARSGNDELALGSVLSAGAIGGLVGGFALSVWGGPKRRIHGALISCFLMAILGSVVVGLGRSLPYWLVGSFFGAFFAPFARGLTLLLRTIIKCMHGVHHPGGAAHDRLSLRGCLGV